jgi:hypothetical protein
MQKRSDWKEARDFGKIISPGKYVMDLFYPLCAVDWQTSTKVGALVTELKMHCSAQARWYLPRRWRSSRILDHAFCINFVSHVGDLVKRKFLGRRGTQLLNYRQLLQLFDLLAMRIRRRIFGECRIRVYWDGIFGLRGVVVEEPRVRKNGSWDGPITGRNFSTTSEVPLTNSPGKYFHAMM